MKNLSQCRIQTKLYLFTCHQQIDDSYHNYCNIALFSFATANTALKLKGSLTANSERTFLFKVIFDLLRLCTNMEYGMPYIRAEALIR